MKISITVPRTYTHNKLVRNTKKYLKCNYNDEVARVVFEGYEKNFYVLVKNRNLQIELINDDVNVLGEIENYLEHMFRNEYIGISTEGNFESSLNIKDVECIMI